MSLRVIVVPEAREQFEDLIRWWKANRSALPTQVEDEFERIVRMLADQALIGKLYHRRGIPGLRRQLMKKTPYHVYYVPRTEEGRLYVVAIWSGARKYGPPISAL